MRCFGNILCEQIKEQPFYPARQTRRRPTIAEKQGFESVHGIVLRENRNMLALGKKLGFEIETFQSNHEGEIVEQIQLAMGSCDGILINPASYTHTSIAIRDALSLLDIPVVEIHLSNINKREPFRHKSLVADIVAARVAGFGAQGYLLALQGLAGLID